MVSLQSSDNSYSSCWFAVCFSSEVVAGKVATFSVLGEDVVLYRGVGGEVCAVKPHCPHLGAHLGNGRVVNGEIECPFHGFRFGKGGGCTHAYPGKKPAKAHVGQRVVVEKYGFVLVWVGDGEAEWDLPDVGGAEEGWSGLFAFQKPLQARQQNVLENLVDFGHLNKIHNVRDYVLHNFDVDANALRYKMTQRVEKPELANLVRLFSSLGIGSLFSFVREYDPNPGLYYRSFMGLSSSIDIDFTILGVCGAVVEIRTNHPIVNKYVMRQLIFPSPNVGGMLTYRTAFQYKRLDGRSFNGGQGGVVERALLNMVSAGAYQEILDEMYLWESQVHQDAPQLAEGDGPIGKYRRFVRRYAVESSVIKSVQVD